MSWQILNFCDGFLDLLGVWVANWSRVVVLSIAAEWIVVDWVVWRVVGWIRIGAKTWIFRMIGSDDWTVMVLAFGLWLILVRILVCVGGRTSGFDRRITIWCSRT